MKSNIIGYEQTVEYFEELIKGKKMPVATLFGGQPNIGKKEIIDYLSKGILCVTNNWCGQCESCKAPFLAHPDIIKKDVNNDSMLKEEMSNLLGRIHQKPILSKKMIVVVEGVDSYSDAAASLLLKAIEDAPSYVHFLMTAVYPESVATTVRSRSLIKKLSPLTVDPLAKKLIANGFPEEEAKRAAYLAGGRVGLALKILKDNELKNKYENWLNTFKKINRMTIADCSSFADEIDKKGEAEEVLSFFQAFLREQVKFIIDDKEDNRRDIQTAIRRSRESKAMLKANIPPRLILEYVFFNQIKA